MRRYEDDDCEDILFKELVTIMSPVEVKQEGKRAARFIPLTTPAVGGLTLTREALLQPGITSPKLAYVNAGLKDQTNTQRPADSQATKRGRGPAGQSGTSSG